MSYCAFRSGSQYSSPSWQPERFVQSRVDLFSIAQDRAYRVRYNRNQIRIDNAYKASAQLGLVGGLLMTRRGLDIFGSGSCTEA